MDDLKRSFENTGCIQIIPTINNIIQNLVYLLI